MSKKQVSPIVWVTPTTLLESSTQVRLAKSADEYIAARLHNGSVPQSQFAKKLEQYYTNRPIAVKMVDFAKRHIDFSKMLIIEPSAGDGAFSGLLPTGSVLIDVDPKCAEIIKADFLSFRINHDGPVAVIGNPPFSAAVAFFNHAALQANVIAMILPRTFKKDHVLRRIDPMFQLVAEMDVPRDAFLREGKPFDVPAVFQIWERRSTARIFPPKQTSHPDFEFTKSGKAHFAIQRVGANAGRIHREFYRSREAHLFVRVRNGRRVATVKQTMNRLDLASVARNTAGYPSIAKAEIVALYSDASGCQACHTSK